MPRILEIVAMARTLKPGRKLGAKWVPEVVVDKKYVTQADIYAWVHSNLNRISPLLGNLWLEDVQRNFFHADAQGIQRHNFSRALILFYLCYLCADKNVGCGCMMHFVYYALSIPDYHKHLFPTNIFDKDGPVRHMPLKDIVVENIRQMRAGVTHKLYDNPEKTCQCNERWLKYAKRVLRRRLLAPGESVQIDETLTVTNKSQEQITTPRPFNLTPYFTCMAGSIFWGIMHQNTHHEDFPFDDNSRRKQKYFNPNDIDDDDEDREERRTHFLS